MNLIAVKIAKFAAAFFLPMIFSILFAGELIRFSLGDSTAFPDIAHFDNVIFHDLRIWTENLVGCSIEPSDFYEVGHCAERLYPFNYPWVPVSILRMLGFSSQYTIEWGIALSLVLLLVIWLLLLGVYLQLHKRPGVRFWCILLLLLFVRSMPFRYASERGQLDQLVAILIIVSSLGYGWISVKRSKEFAYLFLWVMIALSAGVKIYTLPALVLISAIYPVLGASHSPNRSKPRRAGIFYLLFAFIIVSSLYESYTVASSTAFQNLGGNGFGLAVLNDAVYTDRFFLSKNGKVFWFLLGTLMPILQGWMYIRVRSIRRDVFAGKLIKYGRPLQLGSCEVLVIVLGSYMPMLYIVSTNISYKLIFVCTLLIAILGLAIDKHFLFLADSLRLVQICGLASIIMVSLPYKDALYVYPEWLNHFFLYPITFGLAFGIAIAILMAATLPAFNFAENHYGD